VTDSATAAAPLADRARQLAGQYPPRTPECRGGGAAYVALTTTKTTEAACKALATFGDSATRADARALLSQIEQEITP
jgi:hypothetical protein